MGFRAPNITVVDFVCAGNTAAVSGGCLATTDNKTAVLTNCSLVNNMAAEGGALAMKHFSAVHMIGAVVSNNRAQTGAGVLVQQPARLIVESCSIAYNAAERQGGGMYMQAGAVLRLMGSAKVQLNSAPWGGGLFVDSSDAGSVVDMDPSVIPNTITSNDGTYDRDVSVAPAQLSFLGSSSVSGFASQLASEQSVLPVRLNVSGPFGLPCDGQLVQALLHGTQVLGVNCSDSSGVVLMRLNIRQPPGLYTITFAFGSLLGCTQSHLLYLLTNIRHLLCLCSRPTSTCTSAAAFLVR
jgi:hypothetical protein